MSVDLKLYIDKNSSSRSFIADNCLRVDCSHELKSVIMGSKMPRIPMSMEYDEVLMHDDEEGLRQNDSDAYGDELTFTYSQYLHDVMADYFQRDGTSDWNDGVVAFLEAIPRNTRIILYWC